MKPATYKNGKIHGTCHKCPYNAIAEKIRNGEPVEDGERQQAADACAVCSGASDDGNKGINWVHLGGMKDPHIFLGRYTAQDYIEARTPGEDVQVTNAPPTVERAMLDFLMMFSELSQSAAVALHGFLRGRRLFEVTAEYGISKQAISKAFKAACEKFPCLRAICPKVISRMRAKSPLKNQNHAAVIRTAHD